ncbi:hypothetical protein HDU83_007842 [Entophlyctis luteolus]|nr:hypothetical protein HDU83_007842 [Entophlyctis luteolus]
MFNSLSANFKSAVNGVSERLSQTHERRPSNPVGSGSSGKFAQVMSSLSDLALGDYVLKVLTMPPNNLPLNAFGPTQPLDAVLFSGNDPVATVIKRIELHEELWTHAGIIVDKTVLPLPFIEPGKMYIYESVFSGTVVGYTCEQRTMLRKDSNIKFISDSNVLPVDHIVSKGGNHLGPQIRVLEDVVNEVSCNVGICPLSQSDRDFAERRLKEDPDLLVRLYNKYHDFGYPITNILSIVASASQSLYNDLEAVHTSMKRYFPNHQDEKDTVFCSELVSIIYREIGHASFMNAKPDTFTPLAVQVVPEFGNIVYYAKENKVCLIKRDNKISKGSIISQAQKIIKSLALHDHWVSMPPAGGVPPGADAVGRDIDGTPLFVARVKIGDAFYLGKIGQTWAFPLITYFEREVPINFGHEILTSTAGMKWIDARDGVVPANAVKAGMEETGEFLFVARAKVGKSQGVFGVNKHDGEYAPGMVAPHLKAAKIPFGGKELSVREYQVLCN